jgi:CRISPR-associated protein Csd1
MEGRFADWFEDLRIAHGVKDKEHLSLWRLLVSTATQGKTENINPNLSGSVMRAVLDGSPLPDTLLGAVLVRIKAEREISYPRAKLLKAYLNRKSKERKITVSLDKENTNVAYCLGRLFATLEKIQEEANPGINATIRDKFYASASSAPNTVFGNLMRLKNHHLAKLPQGRAVYFEKLLGEEISKFASFPAHLSLDEQGMFAIGYYHQRQDFFTKKEKSDNADAK